MPLSIIVAMSENHVIGLHGDMPWRLPDDLKRFKALTTGHAVIMGRKTFDSIGRPLPNRTNIVITRDTRRAIEGVTVVHSLDEALRYAVGNEEIFIIGGGEIYRQALALADRIYVTLVHAAVDGDTFFPAFDDRVWRLVSDEHHDADDRHAHAFSFRLYVRTA
ncbi:MAG: dihydrofolate reductase [Phycisphaerales bacterium]|nr:MAG: dihydrofolate reductase [Phycisphaerales bacterium]